MKKYFQGKLSKTVLRNISQVIKRTRLDRNLTLEETARGICSLSYLSKIENYAIVPHPSYLEALCERLDINFAHIVSNTQNRNIDDLLYLYMFDQHKQIEEIYQQIEESFYNANDKLVIITYYLSISDLTAAEVEIKRIDEIKSTLSSDQLRAFTILVSIFYNKSYQYRRIATKFELLEKLSQTNTVYQPLFFEQLFIASYYLGNHFATFFYFQKLKSMNLNLYPFHRLLQLKVIIDELASRFEHVKMLENESLIEKNGMSKLIHTRVDHFRGIKKINLGLYEEAFNFFINLKNKTAEIEVLTMYCAYQGNLLTNDEIIAFSKKINYTKFDEAHKMFAQYIVCKINKLNRQAMKRFLKYHALPTNDLSPIPLYQRVYFEELLELGLLKKHYNLFKKHF